MKQITTDIVIIGGGLTGLALAYFLKDSKLSIHILEARDRLGGRILTANQKQSPPLDMGATWLGRKHTILFDLLKQLELEVFEQKLGDQAIYEPISTSPPQLVQLPPNSDPSFRIKNGTTALISALASQLESPQILKEEQVVSIEEQEDKVNIKTNRHSFRAAKVISTLPPYLFLNSIKVSPELPESLESVLKHTHTWMGDSIKVSLSFKAPFWRSKNWSGTIFSSVGPIPEMYDHADYDNQQFALKGFFNSAYFSVSKEERLDLVLKQLRKYYGNQVDNYLHYEEMVWSKETFTFLPYSSHVLPHQNNGHSIFQQPFLNHKLFIAGSETATHSPGYMEGAVRSAKFVAESILNQ
jgi:monoamine oxidase